MNEAAILGPADAWLLGRLLLGESVEVDLASLPEFIRGPASHLAGLAPDRRGDAWAAISAALGRVGDALTLALAAVDPCDPRPEPGAVAAASIRCATVADLARVEAGSRFAWKGWIVGGHLTLLSSEVKVGKTRVGMSLARRLWLGEPWPDGQAATFPERTPTLWIPGDRHHCELADLAAEFGLPPEAVLFNADPESPYGGWDLDDPANVEGLRQRVEAYRPGLVFIDTLWKCTRQNLCSAREVNLVVDPLITIAQEADAAIVAMMHLSIAGAPIGRGLNGRDGRVLNALRR